MVQRSAARIAAFAGSVTSVAVHALLFASWVTLSRGWIRGLPRLDPTLVYLAAFASIEAIFLSTFILIVQRGMEAEDDRRADLTLQISLLAEYEITQLITITKEMAKTLGVNTAEHPLLDELSREVQPERVLEQIDAFQKESAAGDGAGPEPGETEPGDPTKK